MNKRNWRWAAGALLIAVIALGIWALLAGRESTGPGAVLSRAINSPVKIGGPFSLTDQAGNPTTAEDFRGRFMLIYFGYSFCPDVCPTALQQMSGALDLLTQDEAARIAPIFITVDPARDTVPVLADYARHFHPSLKALTGSADQVAAAAKAYRVYYAEVPQQEGPYLMDHTSIIYLMGPDGAYRGLFRHSSNPRDIADKLRQALRDAG